MKEQKKSEVAAPDVCEIKKYLKDNPPKHSREYSIEIVTPMFGGGVKAGVVDEDMPVRATEIRGHLRFWWRAVCGHQYKPTEELFRIEEKIWGSTNQASLIDISIEIINKGMPKKTGNFKFDDKKKSIIGEWDRYIQNNYPTYVLFPFQGQLNEQYREDKKIGKLSPTNLARYIKSDYATARENISFLLLATFSSKTKMGLLEEIERLTGRDIYAHFQTAMWAWINFGGIGARTRRGCGTLFCKDFSPIDYSQFIRDYEKIMLPDRGNTQKSWCIIERILPIDRTDNIKTIWKNLISHYNHFRQGKDFARNPGSGNHPGRSRWPEAESIRQITRMRNPKHQPLPEHPTPAFPRAALGLPIITHFQNGRNESIKDPDDSELLPYFSGEIKTRMASPLILKPLALALTDEKKALPLIIRLGGAEPEGLTLMIGKKEKSISNKTNIINNDQFAQYKESPLKGYVGKDVVDACIEHLKEKFNSKDQS